MDVALRLLTAGESQTSVWTWQLRERDGESPVYGLGVASEADLPP